MTREPQPVPRTSTTPELRIGEQRRLNGQVAVSAATRVIEEARRAGNGNEGLAQRIEKRLAL